MKTTSFVISYLGLCLFPIVSNAALTSVYQFNETNGTSAADSIRGASGTASLNNFDGAQWVAGKIGNAVEFDGADDYILAPNTVPTGSTAFSVSAWILADAAPVWGSIVKNWGGSSTGAFHFGFNVGSGQISNYVSGPTVGPVVDLGALSLDEWHHVALTYDGGLGTQTLYIDGLPSATAAASSSLTALSPNMGIGVKTDNSTLAPDGGNPGFWDGKIDDLAFWDNVLTPAQIATIKANGDLGISAGVPEPSIPALVALGFLGLLHRRR